MIKVDKDCGKAALLCLYKTIREKGEMLTKYPSEDGYDETYIDPLYVVLRNYHFEHEIYLPTASKILMLKTFKLFRKYLGDRFNVYSTQITHLVEELFILPCDEYDVYKAKLDLFLLSTERFSTMELDTITIRLYAAFLASHFLDSSKIDSEKDFVKSKRTFFELVQYIEFLKRAIPEMTDEEENDLWDIFGFNIERNTIEVE